MLIKEALITVMAAASVVAAASKAPATTVEAETFLRSQLSAEQVKENLRYYTSVAHLAGSKGDKEQAEWTKEKLLEYGFEDVGELRGCALLFTPKRRSLTLLSPTRFEASLKEDIIDEDEASHEQDQVPTFHGYGKSGNVTGALVYANYGRKEDYDLLVERGIDLKGKIVIVKYGGIFRGLKVRGAELAGAKGVIIYSDPKDDGYKRGKVYPEGPWRPATGVQRGSVQYLSIYSGDPLTPFEPALPNATRLPMEEAANLPKIPSLPISYSDAEPFLRALKGIGKKASDLGNDWQGGLDFDYWTGYVLSVARESGINDRYYYLRPSADVNLDVEHNYGITPIWNVIATVKGSKYPDRAVIVGNHRDAWVRGAIDPSSGSAAILEYARGMGELMKTGWRPDRTLVIASWDGEEYGLVGSTEYVEHFRDVLNATAVAYVNMDSGCGGPNFGASATPSLAQLIRDVTKDIKDPATGKSIYERWLAQENSGEDDDDNENDDENDDDDHNHLKSSKRRVGHPSAMIVSPSESKTLSRPLTSRRKEPTVGALGSGSDFTGFLQHIGISAMDVGFGSNGDGTYHSNYDSFHWMAKFGDPTFEYHKAAAEVLGLLSIRLLNNKVLPFDPIAYAAALEGEAESLRDAIKEAGFLLDDDKSNARHYHHHRVASGRVSLKPLTDAVDSYINAAKTLKGFKDRVERYGESNMGRAGLMFQDGREDIINAVGPEDNIRYLNDKLSFAERGFLDAEGIPGRPWYRHIIYAPGLWFGYASQTFPAIREAIPSGAGEIQARIKRAAEVLHAAVNRIRLTNDM
ncbi:hypothetical protein HDU67_008129 [Dinochytrium kinnereticum]|nr:hypothetical protein HDU67_008129 [Dinochytrium kinnereticum]